MVAISESETEIKWILFCNLSPFFRQKQYDRQVVSVNKMDAIANFYRFPESGWPKTMTVIETSDNNQEIKTNCVGHISYLSRTIDYIEPYLERPSKFIRVCSVLPLRSSFHSTLSSQKV